MPKAPGQSHRKGISVLEVSEMFATEELAQKWFEHWLWGDERACMRCGSLDTYRCKHHSMPFRCRDCKRYFSVKTGTAMERSKVPLRKWGWAIYLEMTNLKGVSSMKLHRDLDVTQTTAWFMLHRIREAFKATGPQVMLGPVEVDEAFVGGKDRNRHAKKRLGSRWREGTTPVVAAKDRDSNQVVAKVVDDVNRTVLNEFVDQHAAEGAMVYTDGSSAYRSRKNHESVNHSEGEFVRGVIHTNSVESFWSMLKRVSGDNQDENVATIKVRTRGRDATSTRTMAVVGTRGKGGDAGWWGERGGGVSGVAAGAQGSSAAPARRA